MGLLWYSGKNRSWMCQYHGAVTVSKQGRPSCGCQLRRAPSGDIATIPPVDKVHLPHAGRENAK